MNKPRCYIAGKITGLDPEHARLLFEVAMKEVQQLGMEPVSPMHIDHRHEGTWEAYMKRDAQEMASCDAIYMMRNWPYSKGAQIELQCAKWWGMQILWQ
jgi:hypothetical protein